MNRIITTGLGLAALAGTIFTAGAAAAAPAAQNPWVETRLIQTAEVADPMRPLSDGAYLLVPMADITQENGSLVLYRAQTGEAVASLELGYQPLSLIEVRDDVYLVALNDGSVVEVTRDGEDLRVSHEAVSFGRAPTAVLADAGDDRAALITDDGETTVLTVFDVDTFDVVDTLSFDPHLRGNGYHATHDGMLWTTLTDSSDGRTELVGIDLQRMAVTERIPMAGSPQGIAVDADGQLWIADSESDMVRVVDTATARVVDSVELPQGDPDEYPLGVATDRKSGTVAVSLAHLYVGKSAVVVIDQDTHTVKTITPVTGEYPSAVGYDTLGNIWTSNIRHAHGQHEGGSISVVSSTTRNG